MAVLTRPQDTGRTISLKVTFCLSVTLQLKNILNAYLSVFLEHDIVVMPVSDAEDVHGDSVATAGQGEPLQCGRQLAGLGVVALQPLVDQVLLEG